MSQAHKWRDSIPDQIADVCHRLYDQRYLVATSGNVSVRTADGFLITPTNRRKDSISENDIVECDNSGRPRKASTTPSCEVSMHSSIYLKRPDINAAIHAHPSYCLACSLTGISLTKIPLPEVSFYVGEVATVPSAQPGSAEMATNLDPFIAKHNAFILDKHGVLVLGRDLEDAFNRLEHMEHMAHVSYLVCEG